VDNQRLSSAVFRRRLSNELRSLRERAGLTATHVAREVDLQTSTLTRWERNEWLEPDPDKVAKLLDVYGVSDAVVRERLLQLAVDGREEGWWYPWKGKISAGYTEYIGLEAGASKLWTCDPIFVPPLLQTEEYGRAALPSRYPALLGMRADTLDEHIMLLHRRQALLGSSDPIELWAILDESSLHRCPAGLTPEGLARQLQRLHDLSTQDNVVLLVLPWRAGHCPAVNPFTILRFRDPKDPEAGWQETMHGAELLTGPEQVQLLEMGWANLMAAALPRADSMRLIEELAAAPDPSDASWS
jgi:transcriptional regulator with XRE-family HTH domain